MKAFLLAVLLASLAGDSRAGYFLKAANRAGLEKTEAHYLKILSQTKREAGVLSISVAGRDEVFTDNNTNGESFGKYTLIGFFDLPKGRKDFLVFLQLYEGSRIILINGRTGSKLTLEAEPVLSPDKSSYLVASMDLDAGYASNSLTIYRVEDFSKEFAFAWANSDPAELLRGPDKAVWVSNNKVTFEEVSRGSDLSEATRKIGWARHPMSLEKRDGKWIGPLDSAGKVEQVHEVEDTHF